MVVSSPAVGRYLAMAPWIFKSMTWRNQKLPKSVPVRENLSGCGPVRNQKVPESVPVRKTKKVPGRGPVRKCARLWPG